MEGRDEYEGIDGILHEPLLLEEELLEELLDELLDELPDELLDELEDELLPPDMVPKSM